MLKDCFIVAKMWMINSRNYLKLHKLNQVSFLTIVTLDPSYTSILECEINKLRNLNFSLWLNLLSRFKQKSLRPTFSFE